MIIIIQDGFNITATGHAGYAPKGEDIVCSAVSAIIGTLARALEEGSELLEDKTIKLKDGDSELDCVPKEEYTVNVQMIYWTILIGLNAIAESYPENVIFIEGGLEMDEEGDVS